MTNAMAPSATTLSWLAQERKHWINGRAIASVSGNTFEAFAPATAKLIAQVSDGAQADADAAIAIAGDAFADKRWRGLTPDRRAQIMFRLAELIEQDAHMLAELETLDGGKLFAGALHGEVPMAARAFRYYAGWCDKITGETFTPSLPLSMHGLVLRQPVGPVGLITPWNGPLVMAAWKLAPALAAGCSCVLKPSELACLSVSRLAELSTQAGFPDGVINVVFGGRDVGARLVQSPAIAKIAFTGSTATGKAIVKAAAHDLKRVSLELGGKSPTIIFDDADLDTAIPGAAEAIFANAGQICVAGSRLLVQHAVYKPVLEGIRAIATGLRIGDGFDASTQLGPLISEAHLNHVLGFVETARAEGLVDWPAGARVDREGYFIHPAVFEDVPSTRDLFQSEVFGPVLAVTPFDTEAEALALANHSKYGLAASIWTTNIARAHRLAEGIQAGIVWVNAHGAPDMAMPIGGVKQSGWGRECSRAGLDLYTELKTLLISG